MMNHKRIRSIQVVYEDGSEEIFDTIDGYYCSRINYDRGAKHHSEGWRQHEIHWNDKR
jgi:hypothetical protein